MSLASFLSSAICVFSWNGEQNLGQVQVARLFLISSLSPPLPLHSNLTRPASPLLLARTFYSEDTPSRQQAKFSAQGDYDYSVRESTRLARSD